MTPTDPMQRFREARGCPDLDPNWPDILGKPRGPVLCVLYPNCECGKADGHKEMTFVEKIDQLGKPKS